jgi:hypothetical protein
MSESVPYFVYTKTKLSDADWTEQPHLICESLVLGVAPTMTQAALRYEYGTMAREDESTATYQPPLDLLRKFVRITCPSLSISWVGVVLQEGEMYGPLEDVGGTRQAYGTQQFSAVGLEWFLMRKTINYSILSPGNVRIERAIGYNTGMGAGRSVDYEQRANKDDGIAVFAADKDSAALWSAEDIAVSLLVDYAPKDAAGNEEPCSFVLYPVFVEDFLLSFTPTLEVEGHSVWQALNDLFSHSRGLQWRIEYDDALNEAQVIVDSMAVSAIVMPGGSTLNAASSQIALTDADATEWRVSINKRADRRYDNVVCRGARRRAVFTVSIESENLEPSWRSADEAAYRTAVGSDPEVNDAYREGNRFERVYQCFQIPADWNGASNDGGSVPTVSTPACPTVPQGSTSIVGVQATSMPGLRLLRTLPIRVGYDYDDATAPTARDPDNIYSEWQRPFAVIDDDGAGAWRFTHATGKTNDDGDKRSGFSFTTLDGTPGVQFSPPQGMPHTLALNHFDPDTDGASDQLPLVDYAGIRCTVCGEWDAYCEAKYPLADGDSDPLQTLYLSIGERARFDWLADGTVYDCHGETLHTVGSGGPLRDDRELCEQVARIAYEWYGVERADVTIQSSLTEAPVQVGDLITVIGNGAAAVEVNAVVSQITYQLERGGTFISAGFAELDIAGLV